MLNFTFESQLAFEGLLAQPDPIKRDDFAANLSEHLLGEIIPFSIETQTPLALAANLYSPGDEDAIIDAMRLSDVSLRTPAKEVFAGLEPNSKLTRNSKFTSTMLFFDALHFYALFGSMVDSVPLPYRSVIDSAIGDYISDPIKYPSNNEIEVTYTVDRKPRLTLSEVCARIRQVTSEIPTDLVLDTEFPSPSSNAGGLVRRSSLQAEQNTEISFTDMVVELELQNSVLRSSDATMRMIAEWWTQEGFATEDRYVNTILDIIGSQAGDVAWPATPTSDDLLELHMGTQYAYTLDTFCGQLPGLVLYAGIDPSYASNESARPGTARETRALLSDILGKERIAVRDPAQVEVLLGDPVDTKNRIIAFGRGSCYEFLMNTNGSMFDQYQINTERAFVMRKVQRVAGRLLPDASQASKLVTIG